MGNKTLYGIENHWDHPEYIKKERWMRCIFGDSDKPIELENIIEEFANNEPYKRRKWKGLT